MQISDSAFGVLCGSPPNCGVRGDPERNGMRTDGWEGCRYERKGYRGYP